MSNMLPGVLLGLIEGLAAAVPDRLRRTFVEILVGSAVTEHGHVTDAISAAGHTRGWSTYYWLVDNAHWSWLAVWQAWTFLLKKLYPMPQWFVVLDDTLVERCSAHAPDAKVHFNHTAKHNRPRYLWGQGWVCLAAVVEWGDRLGAVPLMLRLVRSKGQRSKLETARLMLRLLGDRLGRVCLLTDAWYMRGKLLKAAIGRGHTVIGRVRKDLALYLEPPPPSGRRGAPRKYGARVTPEVVARLPVQRSAQLLYGKLNLVRFRTCCVAARFLKGELVRVVWAQFERPDQPNRPLETWLLLCTDPHIMAIDVVRCYAKRWSIESLFFELKHHWGLRDAWQQSRQALMRWVTILALGFALNQVLSCTDPARLNRMAQAAPWRRPGTITAGIIRTGWNRIIQGIGIQTIFAAKSEKFRPAGRQGDASGGHSRPVAA